MGPQVPGHAVANFLVDQTELARRTLEAAMDPLTNPMTNPLANPILNPYAGLFAYWAKALGAVAGISPLSPTALGLGMTPQMPQPAITGNPSIKTFSIVYAAGGIPKIRTVGEFDITEWLLVGQCLLEQVQDPQTYGQLEQAINSLLQQKQQQAVEAMSIGQHLPQPKARGNAQSVQQQPGHGG